MTTAPPVPTDPEGVAALLAELRALVASATTEAEARLATARISRVTQAYRVKHGIGIPQSLVAQAVELDPGYRVRPHLAHLSERLAAAVRDVEAGRNRMLAVSMPPRSGKSTLLSKYGPVWFLRKHPDWSIVTASHDADLVTDWAKAARQIIEGTPSLGIRLAKDGGAGGHWETVEGGGLRAVSWRGPLTGRGAKVLIIDDPVANFVDAHSPIVRQILWNWWKSVAFTRLEPPYLVLVVMTRWHEDDFVGRLFSPEHEGDPAQWEKISLPAVADLPDDALGRDPGEPLLSPLLDEDRNQALDRLADTKRAVGGYTWCTPAESPVLMADWTTKPISEVRAGDRVMGYRPGSSAARMVYEPTTVEATSVRTAPVQRLTMESGNVVRCTETHRWYTGRSVGSGRKAYAPATVGSRLLRYVPDLPRLTPDRQRDLDWIAGIIDGEGHLRSNVLAIAQNPDANPDVFVAIRDCLDRLGWSYREEVIPVPQEKWTARGSFRIRNTRQVVHELLERTRLAKRSRALATMPIHKPCIYRDRVEDVTDDGTEAVHALQTGTGNYIVWGYASSNSAMYQQRPAPAKGAIFDSGWWRFWTMNPSLATEDGRVVYLDPSSLTGGRWLDSWDTSFKSKDDGSSSWVVGQRWVRHQANRYLIAQRRGRWSFTQTIAEMLIWARQADPVHSPCGHLVHERLIEERANGAAIIDVLKEKISGLKPTNPTISKEAARAVTPECESGNVFLPHPSDPGNEWMQDFLSELRNFPHDAADDQVDGLSQALAGLRDPGRGLVTVPGRQSRQGQRWQVPRDIARAAASDIGRSRPVR